MELHLIVMFLPGNRLKYLVVFGPSMLCAFDNEKKKVFDICFCLNSLFHVVVQNDEISTRIIKQLNSSMGGRVTFIPLNRVRAPHVSYPQSSDVVPLLKRLKFSPDYHAAFVQVCICHGFCSLLETHFVSLHGYDARLVISLMDS